MTIEEQVLEVIVEHLTAGVPSAEAFAAGVQWVKAHDAADALLDELGVELLGELFYKRNFAQRRRAQQGTAEAQNGCLASVADGPAGPVTWDVPGRPNLNTTLLKGRALLEQLYPIGNGQWKSLGDMTRPDCAGTVQRYTKLAESNAHHAAVFRAIAARLTQKADTVRRRWSEAEVQQLFAGGGGDA